MAVENQELRKAGLKVTLPRVKILQILESTGDGSQHMSAEQVYQALRDAGEEVGLATVYRVLTQFETAGLVVRHNFEAGRDKPGTPHSVFELAKGDHHDHMVCLTTDEVIEFTDPIIEQRQHEIAREHGYDLVDHSLILYVRKKKDQ
jgi:Fur family ferric uptake transcriptional regulator